MNDEHELEPQLGVLPWKRREDHAPLYRDGDRYLVAVKYGGGYDIDVMTCRCDEGLFEWEDGHGETFGAWDWEDVDYYILLEGERRPPAITPTPETEL